MGEIDTKPIEPVQVALTFFGEKGDHQKKNRTSSSSTNEEIEKDKELESLLKELANNKVQMEAKESAYSQLLLKLEHCQKLSDEFNVQLKNSEAEKHVYVQELTDAKLRIDELESKLKEMANQLMESGKLREQLWHVRNELKDVQVELLTMQTELADSNEVKLKALTQAELMEAAADMEKERSEELLQQVEELLQQVEELNEAVYEVKRAACEAEKSKENAIQLQEEVEETRKQLEKMQNLENQLLEKSVHMDSLQAELNQANELLGSSDRAVSEAIDDLNQLKANLQDKDLEISDKAFYIGTLEAELNQLELELKNANEVTNNLKSDVQKLTDELHKEKTETGTIKEAENEAQVEIALLRSELHKERSKLAAAEVAEARAGSVKSGLYLAVQQLAVEAEEVKKENKRLKKGLYQPESDESGQTDDNNYVESSLDDCQKDTANDNEITISLEEYESLIKKARTTDQSPAEDYNKIGEVQCMYEAEALRKELEAATTKIADFRTRAEQAVTRAEAAEKAKLRLEDQINMWKEHKQKRKAALAALREVSSSRVFSTPTNYEITHHKAYQPLGKILNMKF